MLELNNIYYKIGKRYILQNVSSSFEPGKIHMILGPNGSGKSSLLKIFSGEIKKYEGSVLYEGKSLEQLDVIKIAQKRAVLSQHPHLGFPLSVEEVVMMGRYPHFEFHPSPEDKKICRDAMQLLGIEKMSERNYLTLSGGEKQRVQFARILAQIWEKPNVGLRYLFLDEPLNSLDIKYQHDFLQIARSFLDKDTVLIIVIHDINLAVQYGDHLVFMKDGKIVSQGETKHVLNEALLLDVFEINACIKNIEGLMFPSVFFKTL